MVRSLIVLCVLSATACFPRYQDGRMTYSGTIVEPPPAPAGTIHATTAYAYQPEKQPLPPFDAHAAREAFARADLSACALATDGHAKVTFAPNGSVAAVNVDWPNDLDAAPRECIRATLMKTRIAEFDGAAVTIGTTVRASR